MHSVLCPWTADVFYGLRVKGQDIVILLKLVSLDKAAEEMEPGRIDSFRDTSARALAAMTGIGKTEVNNSINRSCRAGLAKVSVKNQQLLVNTQALFEFIAYGIKYVFPVSPAEMTRGIPTAFAAPVLQNRLISAGDTICVWPHASAEKTGQAIYPLYKTVPYAIHKDRRLYEYLALIDAIRIGHARESNLAKAELVTRLGISA